jgi:putative redox protein
MNISIKRIEENFHFQATNEDGATLEMDASPEMGGQNKGMRPTQLLLAAVGGCSSIDVLLILQKQRQIPTSFSVDVEGIKENVLEYSLFRDICLHFKIEGAIDPIKAKKAIELSLDKYCSVSKTFEATAKISFKLTINDETIF